MDQAQFTEKHGAIKLASDTERYFARLRHPQSENGAGPPIVDGHFYNLGYFRGGQNPLEQEHDWAALDTARRLTTSWVRKLRTGKCFALQSEGDGLYFAFICAASPLDAVALGATLDRGADAGPAITTTDRSGQSCLFWADSEDEYYADDLAEAVYRQYRAVSERMLAAIHSPVEIRVNSDAAEFPVIYGGTNRDGLFIGVITACVWT